MSTAPLSSILHGDYSSWAESVERPSSCLYCGHHRVWWNGFWLRTATVWAPDGAVWLEPFRVRRVKCACCRRSWGLRPPGVAPHRHFQLGLIAEAVGRRLYAPVASLRSAAAQVGGSARSVGRWSRWVAGLASPAALLRRVLVAAGEPIQVRLPEVTGLARKATTDLRRQLLLRAGQVLGLLEVLAAAVGLEPPGLRAVLGRVVGDRTHLTTDADPLIPEDAWSRPGGRPETLPM